MLNNVIRAYHDDMAHCGTEKTVQGILSNYWFPLVRKRVYKYIGNCIPCLLTNVLPHTREGEMQLTDEATSSFQTLHADHFGPLQAAVGGVKHVLVVVDAFTKFTWLFSVKTTSSRETRRHLSYLFHTFGHPQQLVTDPLLRQRNLQNLSQIVESNIDWSP